MRFRFLDVLLFALLFIFVNSFPVDLFRLSLLEQELVRMALRIILLSYDIYILWRYRINIFKFANYKRGLLFLPFLLACFSNLIAAGISGSSFSIIQVDAGLTAVVIINFFIGAILEEFFFRFVIHNSLINTSSIKRILGSAAIFALFHLLNMVNVSTVNQLVEVLIQVAYTFGLGILLGVTYEYTYSLPICIVFHFVFNLFNKVFITNIFGLAILDIYVVLTAVVIAILLGAYIVVLYFLKLRKLSRYFNE